MRNIAALLISISTATIAHALDADEIYKFEACKGTKSQFSEKEITAVVENAGQFPNAYRSLGGYVDFMRKYNDAMTTGFRCPLNGPGSFPPHPMLESLVNVTTETAALIAHDIDAQKKLVDQGSTCASIWAKKVKNGAKAATPEAFKELSGKSPSPEVCTAFVNHFVPELKLRYRRMRQYLVLSQPSTILDFKLSHDIPFSNFVGSKFVGTVWKTDGSISRLNRSEIDELEGLRTNLKDDPKSIYYQILSTSPVLLHFTEEPTPDTIASAFQNLKAQTTMDTKAFQENPPQEMMLYTPYVAKAIAEMPKEKRGDACRAVKEIYRNLIFRHEGAPRILDAAVLAASLWKPGKLLRSGFSAALSTIGKRVGYGASAVAGKQTVSNLLVYLDGVNMCQQMLMEKKMTPDVAGLCDVEKTNALYEDAQSSAIASAVMGGAALAWGRAAAPALEARTAKRAASTAEKKAAEDLRRSWNDTD